MLSLFHPVPGARRHLPQLSSALAVTLLVALVAVPLQLSGQSAPTIDPSAKDSGTISGSLVPASNAKLPITGVTVTIDETGDRATVDRRGEFTFPTVKPGTYTLIATGDGFSRLKITDVVVQPDRSVTLGSETMPVITKDGEVQMMEEVVVNAKKEGVETMTPVIVNDVKPQPFSDRNVDLPRGIDDIQPYYIFDNQTLEESGTTDVEDFLKQRLTMDTTTFTNTQITNYMNGRNFTNGASSIDLRGLGADHTLILVNGLPMAGVSVFTGTVGTPGQPDINGIPFAAIDRIEVLPSSAGAIYGASAEGGVINIILKKAYSGGDITATYASTWDGYGPSRTLEGSFGKSFENGKTQLLVVAQYSDSSPMFVGDRKNLLDRGYETIFQNDPSALGLNNNSPTSGFSVPTGSEPNFASANAQYPVAAGTPGVSAANKKRPIGYITSSGLPTTASDPWVLVEVQPLTLKSTGSAFGAYTGTVPAGYSGDSSTLISGRYNLTHGEDNEAPNGLLVPLSNYPRRISIMATLTRQMTKKLQVEIDYSYSKNHIFSNYNSIETYGNQAVILPTTAPDNPFNQSVDVSFPINYNAPETADTTTNVITISGTLKLPFDWITHLSYQWSESDSVEYYDYLNTGDIFDRGATYALTAFSNAPNDNFPTPLYSGAINPFSDTLANPINWTPFSSTYYQSGKSTSNDLILAASGPLWHFPWGDPRLSIRLEHNKSGEPQGGVSSIAPTDPSNVYPGLPGGWYSEYSYGQTQTTDSANAELDLPIFKSKWLFLKCLDAQFNFSNETTTVGVGTPGYLIVNPTTPNPYFNHGLSGGILSPKLPDGQPYRYTTINSNTGITGPALSYKPTDDVVVRFSVASGFVPPAYSQLLPLEGPVSAVGYGNSGPISDPKNPNAGQYYITEVDGGNPQLKPETAKSWNLGVIWEPKVGWLNGLRIDAEFTELKQHNLIESVGDQFIVDNESTFPNLVVRDPTSGLVTTVYNVPINVNEAKNDAWDFTINYRLPTAIGIFDLTGAETIEEHNQQQLSQGAPFS